MGKSDFEKGGWIRGEALGDGKQGYTYYCRRESDPKDSWPYVLKKLKRQKDLDARTRMHIEVATLETLKHPGIVRLVESNAREFGIDAELYLVTNRVFGPDLQETVRDQGPLGIPDAVKIIRALLETLTFVHSKDVTHRDIKPCHVILQDGDRTRPVLIDFGLSFNQEVDIDGATTFDAIIGNRFIGMPEQQVGSGGKRDHRSDLTQCVGILLYIITRANAPNPKRGVDKTTFCGLLEGIQRHSRSPAERRHETWTTV